MFDAFAKTCLLMPPLICENNSQKYAGITEIIEEVCGISGILGEQIVLDTNVMEEDFSKVEEQFTMARVYANKTKTIVESLTQEQRKQTGTVLI